MASWRGPRASLRNLRPTNQSLRASGRGLRASQGGLRAPRQGLRSSQGDVGTFGISPHSTGFCPFLGLLPKKDGRVKNEERMMIMMTMAMLTMIDPD